MPLHHAEVAAQRRTLSIDFGELGSLSVTYNPGQMTPDFQQGMLDGPDEAKGIGEARILATIIKEWDYLDEKQKALPVTFENLRTVSIPILDRIMMEVFADLRPKPKPSENSAGSF